MSHSTEDQPASYQQDENRPEFAAGGTVRRARTVTTGKQAVGALAVGALAFGALALGALAIGRLVIGSARIRHLEIDELEVGSLRVRQKVALPESDDDDR